MNYYLFEYDDNGSRRISDKVGSLGAALKNAFGCSINCFFLRIPTKALVRKEIHKPRDERWKKITFNPKTFRFEVED